MKPHTGNGHGSCFSNEKQIGLALLSYSQDYNDKLPSATSYSQVPEYTKPSRVAHDRIGKRTVGFGPGSVAGTKDAFDNYVKNKLLFICPTVYQESKGAHFTYMLNDLAAGSLLTKDFINRPTTIMVAEGEDQIANAGHAWTPDSPPEPAVFDSKGNVLVGATVKNAPKRHSDGANYLFADGHAKWMKPETVFFPDRLHFSHSHIAANKQIMGPDPNGKMQFGGHTYTATFHLR